MSRSKKGGTSHVTVSEVQDGDEDMMMNADDEKKVQGVSGFISKIYKVRRRRSSTGACGWTASFADVSCDFV